MSDPTRLCSPKRAHNRPTPPGRPITKRRVPRSRTSCAASAAAAARVRGQTKTAADFKLLAGAVNLTRLATLGLTHQDGAWATNTA